MTTDQKARDRIIAALDVNIFVEAGAGSGKTTSLTGRLTALIVTGRAKIEEISAVTFTKKAAAELRERFQVELEKAFGCELNKHTGKNYTKEESALAEVALLNFEKASISTIHSFCARLLRERPVEAGIDPGFEELEEAVDLVKAEECWSEFLRKKELGSDSVFTMLVGNGVMPSDLKDSYFELLRNADILPLTTKLEEPDILAGVKHIETMLEEFFALFPAQEPEGGWNEIQQKIISARNMIKHGYLAENRLAVQMLYLFDVDIEARKVGNTQDRWLQSPLALPRLAKGEKERDVKKELSETAASHFYNIAAAAVLLLRSWKEYLHYHCLTFVSEAVADYEKWRQERSYLNFQDLLRKAAGLLKGSPEVRSYFKDRIKYLLVDEFQDTDPIQAELILLLTGSDNKIDDWRELKPKAGSLFVVGDPKQSIYRFRRADIGIYDSVKKIFKGSAGEVLELISNFRSVDNIGEYAEKVLKPLFTAAPPYQAPYAKLATCNPGAADKVNGVFKLTVDKLSGNPAKEIAAQEAEFIANWIKNAVNGGHKFQRTEKELKSGVKEDAAYGDFMILTRGKRHLTLYARALEELKIPYELDGGDGFSSSEELFELYRLLKALDDHKNAVALLAVLRGIFFGVGDDLIYKYKLDNGRFSYFEEPDAKKHPELAAAFGKLREYRTEISKLEPVSAVEKIVELTGLVAYAVLQPMGGTRAGNILKLLELLRKTNSENGGTMSGVVSQFAYLLELKDLPGEEIEEMSLTPVAQNVVRVMNLHKAKGLEATVVFLADPIASSKKHPPKCHINRKGKEAEGFFTVQKPNGEHQTTVFALPEKWEEKEKEENKYINAEKIRLDYVAATRAKNMLIIGKYEDGTAPRNWINLYYNDMPELVKLAEVKIASVEPKALPVNAFSQAEKELGERKAKAKLHSYEVESVTSMVKGNLKFRSSEGDGMAWGNAVHSILELLGKDESSDFDKAAVQILTENEISTTYKDKLLALLEKVKGSDLWKLCRTAKQRYFEVPIAVYEGNTVIHGIIDLVFKDPKDNKWIIADYKTDDYENDPEREKAYEKQINMYARYWANSTGEEVKIAKLIKVK